MHRVPLIVSVLLAGILAGGAVGVIVGASSVPTLRACVQTGGVMRYLASGKCASGEKLLTWNVKGVPGPQGPTGATGPQGPAGSGSGSSVPVFYTSDGPSVTFSGSETVGSLKVPAGSYLIDLQGTAVLSNGPGSALCTITTDPALDPVKGPGIGSATLPVPGSFAVRGYAEFAGPTTIYGRCSADPGASITGARLIASAAQRLAPLP